MRSITPNNIIRENTSTMISPAPRTTANLTKLSFTLDGTL